MEQVDPVRRLLPAAPRQDLGWRIASVAVSLISMGLIAATLAYKLRGFELPSVLLLGLLVSFATVVLLLSRFLFQAYREQHQTTGALQSTEREFQSVFETALDTILILDDHGACREANPAAEHLLGIRREQLIGESIGRFYKDPGRFKDEWTRLLTQDYQHGDAELRNNGDSIFVEFTAKTDCLPGRHVMILRDITQRRRAQASLVESEERFQQMADNIREIFWMLDAETRQALYVNQAYETITGRSCDSLRENPSSYEDLIHPKDRVHVLTKLEEATRSGHFDEKFRILGPKAELRWVWVRGFPVRDDEGKIRRLVGTALEITALKEAEEQGATNLALANSAWAEAEALRKATLALTQDLRMDYVLDALLQSLFGLVPFESARVFLVEADLRLFVAREKLLRESVKKTPDYPVTLDGADFPLLKATLAGQRSFLLTDTKQEKEWRPFKGHTDLRSWLCVPLVAANRALGLLSIAHTKPNAFTQEHLRLAKSLAIPAAAAIQNARLYATAEIYGSELEKRIEELRSAQEALKQAEGHQQVSEDKFQKVFRSSPIAFSITTLEEGRFLDVNVAFEKRYGYSREELIGHTVLELGMWKNSLDRARLVTHLQAGGPVRNVVTELRLKSGEIKVTAYSADRIQFDGQTCILAVSEDIPQNTTVARA
jgi:PAS domain S-box-containing protein